MRRKFGPAVEDVMAQCSVGSLYGTYEQVLQANTLQEISEAAAKFSAAFGFDRYSFVYLHDDFSSSNSCRRLGYAGNEPEAFRATFDDPVNIRRDPVAQALKQSTTPFAYDQSMYTRDGLGEMWETQAVHGYAEGIATALHMPSHRHFCFGVDTGSHLPASRGDIIELIAAVQLFATFAHAGVRAIFGSCDPTSMRAASLSPRERECLRWAAEGKTAWETGRILSIAEGSVAKVLSSAIRKLDCASKPQAVVKAMRLGFIQ